MYWGGRWIAAQVFTRADLTPGDVIVGPALIAEPSSTTLIDPGWRGQVLSQGEMLLEQTGEPPHEPLGTVPILRSPRSKMGLSPSPRRHADLPEEQASAAAPADPILLEIFNHRFAGIAEQMGLTLRNTASSVNVKERLDFSCAIFTAAGDLVVNAPHIPVHLGAMSETVRRVLADNPATAARRRGGDERSLSWRLAFARRDRRHADSRLAPAGWFSSPPVGRIMPKSAAWLPARCLPNRVIWPRKEW